MKPAPNAAPGSRQVHIPSQLIADNTLLFDSKTLPGLASLYYYLFLQTIYVLPKYITIIS